MSDDFSPDAVALLLSEIWPLHKTEQFTAYLAATSALGIAGPASFDCIYISQAEDGDIPNGVLRSAVRWWQVDDSGIKSIRRPDLPVDVNAPENIRSDFYITPVVRFFNRDSEILIGEWYGPRLFSRKVAKLEKVCGLLVISDIRVVLTWDML